MAVKQRGNHWQVDVTVKGARFRGSRALESDADLLEAKAKYLLTMGVSPDQIDSDTQIPDLKTAPDSSKSTLLDMHKIVCQMRWKGTKGERTAVRNSEAALNYFGKSCDVASISQDAADNYITHLENRGNSPATINRKISALRVVLQEAVDRDLLDKIPKLRRKKEGSHRIRWLQAGEEEAILNHLNYTLSRPDVANFCIVALDTGLRFSEIIRLVNMDYQNGKVFVWENKADHPRAVPATKRVAKIIEELQTSSNGVIFSTVTYEDIRWCWDKLRIIMKLQEDVQFTFHVLRHTCCSRLVQEGVPLKVVQEWMGHKSILTTMRYAHLAPDNLDVGRIALEGRKL